MTPSRWAIFAVIVAVLFGGLYLVSRSDRIDVSSIDPSAVVLEGEFKDNVYGNKDAKVTIIEYGDFQCPSCERAYPGLKKLKAEFNEDIRFVFRHFPLTSIHPNALAASATAQAAAEQGKFWEMHDLLYENQSEWSGASASNRPDLFRGYAQKIGLNVDTFNSAIESDTVTDYINYQRQIGNKAGVDSTPTIFVNGEKLASNSDEYKSLLEGDDTKLTAKITQLLKK